MSLVHISLTVQCTVYMCHVKSKAIGGFDKGPNHGLRAGFTSFLSLRKKFDFFNCSHVAVNSAF